MTIDTGALGGLDGPSKSNWTNSPDARKTKFMSTFHNRLIQVLSRKPLEQFNVGYSFIPGSYDTSW